MSCPLSSAQCKSCCLSYLGGALYQDYGGILSVSGSLFENNTADGYGGAIFSGMNIYCCVSF